MKTPSKDNILTALRLFISQRSGIVWADYVTSDIQASRAAFMSDYRTITKHGRDARALLRFIATRDTITERDILESQRQHLLRLEIKQSEKGVFCDYTTGQNFATEYRSGACQLLASVIWDWLRECGYKTGDEIRKAARNNLGRGIASRWFN